MPVLLAAALAAVVPGGQPFACTPVAVYDVDAPLCFSKASRVRPAGIAACEGCHLQDEAVMFEREGGVIVRRAGQAGGVRKGRTSEALMLVRSRVSCCWSESYDKRSSTAD